MAWIMGFTKHFDSKLPNGSLHVGWVDAKSGDPVDDKDIMARYEADILAHLYIRFIGGDECDTCSGEWFANFKKGARILVPKAVSFIPPLDGQLQTGLHSC